MLLQEHIVDIKKPDGICLVTFAVDEFSGLFLHLTIFSIYTLKICINNEWCFWYGLNSNILVSLEGIIMLQKSLFSLTLLCS